MRDDEQDPWCPTPELATWALILAPFIMAGLAWLI
jgi:hypothetical protein